MIRLYLKLTVQGEMYEVLAPEGISVNEFLRGILKGYGIHVPDSRFSLLSLSSEDPAAFLSGNRTLEEFGLRNGSRLMLKGVYDE